MSSMQQSNRFLPFTNNNVQRKQLPNQGGLTHSLSGSDTDVSTSNENLSNEERYVIRHTARQEPQGQENQQHSPSRSSSHKENIPNIQGNLVNRNTLKDNLSSSNRNSLKESLNGSNRNSLKDSINGSNRNSLKDNLSNRTSIGSNRSSLDVSTSSYNTLIIHNANEDNLWASSSRLSGVVREHGDVGYLYSESGIKGHSNSPTVQSLSSLPLDEHFYENTSNTGCQEITDIPDDYLNQSQVLKHLAKEVKVPSYSKLTDNENCTELRISEGDRRNRSEFEERLPTNYTTTLLPLKNKQKIVGLTDKLTFSRSQPDLSRISKTDMENYDSRTTSPRPQTKGREEYETPSGEVWPTSEMVQILIQENSALKLELDRCYKKVAKSQQLEQEISKVHRAHEELVASSERREKLERAARVRLQSDCRRMTELNRALRDQIDLLSTRTESSLSIDSMRKELTQKELFIGQLITQTKELAAAKERQEIELAAQRATLQEQRTHIEILDTALTNAQSNVVRLEEESRKKQVYVERVGQLQRALSSLQASSDRREETERQLRGQLERELREGGAGGSSPAYDGANGESVPELKRKLRQCNEKIMSLEGDVAKWEQRYLEESALRQAAIDAASLPKDAKIAALEKTSQDAEKLIAEARSEKMRHMDEVHAAQKKLADLESRMKDLESKLAERDAMIRVLQKHTYDKESSSSGVGSYQAAHSSHSSTSADHHHTALTSAPELVSSVLGGASGYSSTASYGVSDAFKYRKQGSFEQTNKSLGDQLKDLDSQLLSTQILNKRALCCFPGFSNPGALSRKGKIPKPLLASVESAGGSSTASSKSRLLGGECADDAEAASNAGNSSVLSASNAILDLAVAASRFKSRFSDEACKPAEDMMLLEKQGRSSQRQRMSSSQEPPNNNGNAHHQQPQQQQQQQQQQQHENRRAGSLPPSSLPRPPRSSKSGARYCRLSDSETRKKSEGSSNEVVYRFEPPPPPTAASPSSTQPSPPGKLSLLRRKQSSESILMNALGASAGAEVTSAGNDFHHHHHYHHHHHHRESGNKKSVGQYERLGGGGGGGGQSSRSLIPPPPGSNGAGLQTNPRRYVGLHPGDYGRLSDSASEVAKQVQSARGQSTGSIVSTKSDSSTTSAILKSANRSIPRPSNYKIQF